MAMQRNDCEPQTARNMSAATQVSICKRINETLGSFRDHGADRAPSTPPTPEAASTSPTHADDKPDARAPARNTIISAWPIRVVPADNASAAHAYPSFVSQFNATTIS